MTTSGFLVDRRASGRWIGLAEILVVAYLYCRVRNAEPWIMLRLTQGSE